MDKKKIDFSAYHEYVKKHGRGGFRKGCGRPNTTYKTKTTLCLTDSNYNFLKTIARSQRSKFINTLLDKYREDKEK